MHSSSIRQLAASLMLMLAPALHAGKAQQLTSPDQVPEGLEKSDWSSIRAAHKAWEHSFLPTEDGFQAHNPGQQWVARFDGRGFMTTPNAASWTWGLEFRSYGFGKNLTGISGEPEVRAEGQRLSYRWSDHVEEWFVNDRRGLEHGFIVKVRPQGGQAGEALAFTMSATGSLKPAVSPDAQTVHFRDAAGAPILNYSGLKVWDADGTVMPSRFEVVGSEVRLLVEESGARYPLTIDPIAQQAYLKPAFPPGYTGAGDNFGCSVAVSGDTVVVGAINEDSSTTGINSSPNEGAFDAGAAYVFVRSGTEWSQQAYLKASQVDSGDNFGRSVAVSGDTVVVGANLEGSSSTGINSTPNEGARGAGAAYVFVRNGTTWSQQAYLKPAAVGNTQAGDNFGISVAVSGDTVVVGAEREDSAITGINSTANESAGSAGAAYVFVRSGTTWSQQAYLKASQVNASDNFGFSVAVSGDTVVVGAIQEDSSTTGINGTPDEGAGGAGAAYVFVRSGTAWSEQAYLKASQVNAGDNFGWSVAVSGDTLVVGAINEDSGTTGIQSAPDEAAGDAGAAYVFLRSGETWIQQAYLKSSQVTAGDLFGWSVAVSGDTAVVGAAGEDSSTAGINGTPDEQAINSGAAYVFERSGAAWSEQAYLKASQVNESDLLGLSVAVSGDTVVVGAEREDSSTTGINSMPDEAAGGAGAAYVFVRSGMTWSQQAYVKPADQIGYAGTGDRFGCSVAVSGDTVVVGANLEDSATTGINSTPDEQAANSGAAYVFVRSGAAWSQQAYLKPAAVGNTQAGDNFGISVAVSGDTLVVGAEREDSSTTGINSTPDESAGSAGAAYVFVRSGTTWSQQAYLKASQVNASDNFGFSVAMSGDTVVVGAYLEDSSTTGINGTPDEGASDAGAAYVFLRSGTAWSQRSYLKAGQVTAGDRFGWSVAASGDTVVVGAEREDSSTTGINSMPDEAAGGAGAAYVFVRNGTTWSQQAYLKAGQVTASDSFGWSLAVSGDTVVVGAIQEDSSTTGINSTPNEAAGGAGAAYVFARSGTEWSQQAYLKAGQVNAGDNFGWSVAVSGDTVVVGANGEDGGTTGINSAPDEGGFNAGAAYVFVRSGTTWSERAYLKAGQVTAGDFFGNSVAVNGDTVVVGADQEDSSSMGINSTPDEGALSAGAAYIFIGLGPIPAAYPTWAASKGLTGALGFENGKTDDPDFDGYNNLTEFALDGNPLSGANDGKVIGKIVTLNESRILTVTLPVRNLANFPAGAGDRVSDPIDGIVYRIEGDVNLSTFADTISEVTPALGAGLPVLSTGWSYRTFRAPGTVSTVPQAFLRAGISEAPEP